MFFEPRNQGVNVSIHQMNIYMSFIKNAAAFGKLVGICAGYEGRYNPAPQNLNINALRLLAEKASNANRSVSLAHQLQITASGQRREAFRELPALAKRLRGEVNNLTTDEATKYMLKQNLSLMAGFTNDPAVKNKPAEVAAESLPGRRSGGTDFSTRLATFETVVSTLSGLPGYAPSSEKTGIESLQKKIEALKDHMAQVNKAKASLAEAQRNRRKVFYHSGGVYETTRNVKNVFKAVFGNPSDELDGIRSIVDI